MNFSCNSAYIRLIRVGSCHDPALYQVESHVIAWVLALGSYL